MPSYPGTGEVYRIDIPQEYERFRQRIYNAVLGVLSEEHRTSESHPFFTFPKKLTPADLMRLSDALDVVGLGAALDARKKTIRIVRGASEDAHGAIGFSR